jgi:SAM-dependent methyltransferase
MHKPSTERFTDRVDNYVKYRPSYPPEIIDTLRSECGLRPEHVIADVASGTGIFTRLLLENGNHVFAVEPNAAMRAASAPLKELFPNLTFIAGTAEQTTLPSTSVDFVTVAQAAHWVDTEKAPREFERILKPDGWCMLVWNERRTLGTAFLEEYDRILHTYCPEYKEKRHGRTEIVAHEFFAGRQFKERVFQHRQEFDFAGLKGRLLSSSYCPLEEHANHAPMLKELERIFRAHAQQNKVWFEYDTRMYFSQLTR